MRILKIFITALLLCFLVSCHTSKEEALPPQLTTSKEDAVKQNLTELSKIATTGDLVTRISDEIISQQVIRMNEKDQSFSHAGIVIEQNGVKKVYHIMPNIPGLDTIQAEPIDSFLNPATNIRCGLFRYQLSSTEKENLTQIITTYKQNGIHFDPVYDLGTEDKLYCSEMISKALTKATNGRMQFRTVNAPERMLKVLVMFFKKQGLSKEVIANRKFVSLDNLYLRPDCKELMRFDLKIFPGQ
jgi:hypothetical protein